MSVIPTYVRLPDDSTNTGKKIESVQLTDDLSNVVLREMVSIGDPSAVDQRAGVDALGRLQVAGQNITPTESNPNIASTAGGTTLFSSNASAKYRYFLSTSSTVVWIRLNGGVPAVGTGMRIGPYGSYEMSPGNGNVVTGLIKGIAESGTVVGYCLEGT